VFVLHSYVALSAVGHQSGPGPILVRHPTPKRTLPVAGGYHRLWRGGEPRALGARATRASVVLGHGLIWISLPPSGACYVASFGAARQPRETSRRPRPRGLRAPNEIASAQWEGYHGPPIGTDSNGWTHLSWTSHVMDISCHGHLMGIKDHIRAIPDVPTQGILFHDTSTPLSHIDAWQVTMGRLAKEVGRSRSDVVGGSESRGFLVAARWRSSAAAASSWSARRTSCRARPSPTPTTWSREPTPSRSRPTPSSRAGGWSSGTTCWRRGAPWRRR
jgi:hypothetical protein